MLTYKDATWFDWLILPVIYVMGCPCCGPEWYRSLFRKADDIAGREYDRLYDNKVKENA